MEVKIIKGTEQIGGCITEISTNKTKIIIDFGEDLESNKKTFHLEGLTDDKPKYDAVFITHSHGDHIGLIDKINKDIPVYVEEKTLVIHNLTCDFCGKTPVKRKINTFKLEKNIKNTKPIFDNGDIKVTPFIVDHSSYNSCMYLIESENSKILHTGDFRNNGRKGKLFEIVLNKMGKVDLLITEGTTLSRNNKKCIKEDELEIEAKKIIRRYNQVFVMQSSTNIDRTVSFLRASLSCGKKFILDLFSYYINKEVDFKADVDYKKVFVWKPVKYKKRPKWFKDKYLNIKTSARIMPYYTMEVKESMLDDIKMLYSKGMIKKACFIYSMWDGYIEKEEKLKYFINELEKMNIEFIELHTSGHADREAMKKINEIVNPDNTIIIHTENSELGTSIFNNVVSLKDGQIFELK